MPFSSIFGTDSVWTPTTSPTRHMRIDRPSGFTKSLCLSLLLGNLFIDVSHAAISLVYCSPDNTGADYSAYNYNYQSDGECYNHCVGKYAFGVVLGKNCWCTNVIPDDQKDLDDCSDPCPGYPDDKCGNSELEYFNYVELPGVVPSSKSKKPSSTTVRSTRVGPTTVSVPVTVTFTPSEPSTSSTKEPLMTTDPPTTPIISITTILGSQMTITVMPTTTGPTTSSFPVNASGSGDFFSNAGRAAGVIIGIFLAIALIVGLVFFFIRKRRKDRRNSVGSSNNPEMGMSGAGSPNLGTGSASPNNRPRSTSTLGFVGGLGQDKGAAVTTMGLTESERLTDQRLDPNQIWMRFDNDNGSRVSLRSLQDNQDYSRRVLKLTNPDG